MQNKYNTMSQNYNKTNRYRYCNLSEILHDIFHKKYTTVNTPKYILNDDEMYNVHKFLKTNRKKKETYPSDR